ncbi:hypothetical protein BJ878DRAFT_510964 [Calycina marina]|uniref:Uncharacterized protein n=1 Tax=Calycina marina TaxID=1763456 RepID=A0A9P8CDT9_9HELO|nr:hypothetical protein BJ878DRAFT_510964 [Calycina marina]
MTLYMGCLLTSQGSATRASSDPADSLVIDPKNYATEADKHVMCEGFKMYSRLIFDTFEGKDLVIEKYTPPGQAGLGVDVCVFI